VEAAFCYGVVEAYVGGVGVGAGTDDCCGGVGAGSDVVGVVGAGVRVCV
jgi:hypothetical protein